MLSCHITPAECLGGDTDLLRNQRTTIGFFPRRSVDGESSIGRCVAFVDDDEFGALMERKASLPVTKFGDCHDPERVDRFNGLTSRL